MCIRDRLCTHRHRAAFRCRRRETGERHRVESSESRRYRRPSVMRPDGGVLRCLYSSAAWWPSAAKSAGSRNTKSHVEPGLHRRRQPREETSSRFTSACPAARVVEMVTPTVLKFEVRPRTPCRRARTCRRPWRVRSNPAAAAERGIARALEPADASGMSPARFLLGSPGGLSPSAPRLTDPVSRNARRLSPTARCP